MSTTLTIQSLIEHFENQLYRIDRQNLGDIAGREPQFPQLVIYLGGNARNAHQAVSASLLQTWPQYQAELKFLWVQANGEKLSFSQLPCDGDQPIAVSEEEVREIASALFGTRMHFSDRSKLLIYYVLDTTSFAGAEEFTAWLPRIRRVKDMLCTSSTDMLDVLYLLLNENLNRQKTASAIRNHLSGFYQNNDARQAVDNILLLSNRRSDNAILEDWDICYKILSATIVLSNNADTEIATDFFCGAVMTASYAREEKPLPQIGQVVVTGLIEELSRAAPQGEARPLEDPHLPDRLGLTNQGTFSMLDQYAESTLYSMLPTEAQLELFPRRDDAAQTAMCALPARAFNGYTMGAWGQYLSGVARGIREKISMDSPARTAWQERYKALLVANFSREEIIHLAGRLQDVAQIMSRPKAPSQEAPVLTAARDQLKYMLSSDQELVQIFLSALREQGRISQDFSDMWSSLIKSMRKIHAVRDSNIATFYDRKVRDFYDRHGSELYSGFVGMHDTDELAAFLTNTLDHIIDSNEIFSSAFEDELESRLSEEALPVDAKQYIRKKLTGNDVYVYLQTNFALGDPLISAILLKVGTPLYNNLSNNLPPTTYYYNTGSSNTAESLVIYQVSAENLVSGEEE